MAYNVNFVGSESRNRKWKLINVKRGKSENEHLKQNISLKLFLLDKIKLKIATKSEVTVDLL